LISNNYDLYLSETEKLDIQNGNVAAGKELNKDSLR
jgi:hypothetical protein